jgi:hypothetical protein
MASSLSCRQRCTSNLALGEELPETTSADYGCDKLNRALRAEIDESASSTLHSPTSRPLSCPTTVKIVIKVITHCGDEGLQEGGGSNACREDERRI